MASPFLKAAAKGLDTVVCTLENLRKQTAFANAQAAHDAAWSVQKWTVKELLPKKFTLRSKGRPWQESGKYRFAVEPRRPNRRQQSASVGTIAPWITDHEFGGRRSGPKSLGGVPYSVSARPSPGAVIPRRLMPSRALKKRGAVLVDVGKTKGIFIPQGKGMRLLYWVNQGARIRKTLGFISGGSPRARKAFEEAYPRRFAAALASSKPKGKR